MATFRLYPSYWRGHKRNTAENTILGYDSFKDVCQCHLYVKLHCDIPKSFETCEFPTTPAARTIDDYLSGRQELQGTCFIAIQ
jgi:hypothetical protein